MSFLLIKERGRFRIGWMIDRGHGLVQLYYIYVLPLHSEKKKNRQLFPGSKVINIDPDYHTNPKASQPAQYHPPPLSSPSRFK